MADNRMQKFYQEAAKNGFTQEDVDRLKKFSTIMASKITKMYLLEFIDQMAFSYGIKNMSKKEIIRFAKSTAKLSEKTAAIPSEEIPDSLSGKLEEESENTPKDKTETAPKDQYENESKSSKTGNATFGAGETKKGPSIIEIYDAYHRLLSKLNRLQVNDFVGFSELPFNHFSEQTKETTKYCLRYQLSIVPSDHIIKIQVPEKIARNVMMYIDKHVDIQMNFYKSFIHDNKLIDDLAIFAPDIDVSQLQLDEKNRTMFLSEKLTKKIGILCFYVDELGNPIVK